MSIINSSALLGAGADGYQISRSLRFNSADSAYLNRTPAATGTSRRIFTISLWLKRSALLGSALDFGFINAGGDGTTIGISGTGAFGASLDNTIFLRNGGSNVGNWSAVFRDASAWYHFVVAIDSTQATASNRQKLYVNGVDYGACSGSLTLNADTSVNHNVIHLIGGFSGPAAGYYANGYLAEYHLIDGQALTPSSFGETDTITGVWKPKKYSGSGYGTNGFYLNFSDNSGITATTLGKDYSGNGNNWTPAATFSVTAGAGNDSLIDTPTPYADGGNGRGNYCTANPLKKSASATLSDGNLSVAWNSNGGEQPATFAVSSGKWYWEVSPNAAFSAPGILLTSRTPSASSFANDYHYYGNTGLFYTGVSGVTYGAGFGNGDVIGVALDLDTNQITFYKNGVSQGVKTIAAGEYNPDLAGAITVTNVVNFGQRPFAYTPPSGFLALNTQNLPEPSIKKPSSYMDVVTYTADSNATKTITGLGFNPDLVWIKNRNSTNQHAWFDSVRGVNKYLGSDRTIAEENPGQYGYVSAFNSDGFTLTTSGPSGFGYVNGGSNTYVAWCWDESATPGFDIVTYTGDGVNGRQISHNLGVKPKLIIEKGRGSTYNWSVQGCGELWTPATSNLFLNGTSGLNASGAYGAPTSTYFYPSLTNYANENGVANVAYLWSEVAGFSKFGSYSSNGSSDGPYVHCGFRPKAVWIKKATGTTNANSGWCIFDSTRSTYNTTSANLRADLSDAESTFSALDFTSTGFKLRVVSIEVNGATSGDTYIFCAWAETPAKFSLAR